MGGGRPPASAGVEVTTRQVTVVQDADTGVLVHPVATALVVRTPRVARVWPADDEQPPVGTGSARKAAVATLKAEGDLWLPAPLVD
jgi:hypothetical protein